MKKTDKDKLIEFVGLYAIKNKIKPSTIMAASTEIIGMTLAQYCHTKPINEEAAKYAIEQISNEILHQYNLNQKALTSINID